MFPYFAGDAISDEDGAGSEVEIFHRSYRVRGLVWVVNGEFRVRQLYSVSYKSQGAYSVPW